MSGRLGYKKAGDGIAERIAKDDADRNRRAARMMLQRLIVRHAGWKGLDAWAENVLDKLEKGGTVDLAKLKADIESWSEAHKEWL